MSTVDLGPENLEGKLNGTIEELLALASLAERVASACRTAILAKREDDSDKLEGMDWLAEQTGLSVDRARDLCKDGTIPCVHPTNDRLMKVRRGAYRDYVRKLERRG